MTSLVSPPANDRYASERALPGIRKAAILVVAVGDELGKKYYRIFRMPMCKG